MGGMLLAIASALWLGILTSLSPCPLATNIVAISYVGQRAGKTAHVLMTGLLYALGRMLAYAALGALVVGSVLAAHRASHFVQTYMPRFLGPVLILAGMVLLGLIELKGPNTRMGERLQARVQAWGMWGGALLGVLFALSFCPVSAVLFFGSLIPLAASQSSSIVVPCAYGLGTALPVLVLAVPIAVAKTHVGKMYNRLKQVELWARRATGVIFIGVGIYYCLAYIFGVLS